MFRNEGKRSKSRFREKGSLEPFGPSPVAFPTEVSSCCFPASLLPNPQRWSARLHAPLLPLPPSRCPRADRAVCSLHRLVTWRPARAGGAWPGTQGRRATAPGNCYPTTPPSPQGRAGSANQLRQPRWAKRKWALGLGIVGGEPGTPWRSPLGPVRQEPCPCLARGTVACGICPAAP